MTSRDSIGGFFTRLTPSLNIWYCRGDRGTNGMWRYGIYTGKYGSGGMNWTARTGGDFPTKFVPKT